MGSTSITEGHVDEDGDEIFDMADELEHDIMTAQERLEKIYDFRKNCE